MPTYQIRHRSFSSIQKLLLCFSWIGAIGLICLLAQNYTPSNPIPGWLIAACIGPAFLLTIFICSFPSGKAHTEELSIPGTGPDLKLADPLSWSLSKKVLVVAYVIVGMGWVSCIAPILLGMKLVYESEILSPQCESALQLHPNWKFDNARLYLPSNSPLQFFEPNRPIECYFNGKRDKLLLSEILSKPSALNYESVGVLVVLLGTLIAWGVPTVLVLYLKLFRARRAT